MNQRSMFLTALIAGAVIGILGNLPILNLVNCILCLWVWVGGALSVFIYRRFQPAQAPLTGAQGAMLGAASGVVGAVVGLVVYLITAPLINAVLESVMRSLQAEGQVPLQSTGTVLQAFIWFAIDLVLYTGFGALSGLITANMARPKSAAST